MVSWKSKGREVKAESTGKVELCLAHAPDAVIISSNPALHVPNFDRCRRDNFCRCRACKPALG
jgi:hypothetical protein